MPEARTLRLDVVIFGGGAAGLWLLDALRRDGRRVLLLEAGNLGSGQTIAAQGIIHGGLKYALGGLLTSSARSIREMPTRWRRCLAGEEPPDLRATRRRADYCHLWQTRAAGSRMGMLGARAGLRIRPERLEPAAWPAPLCGCPGVVARLDEQVIDPGSFLGALLDQHTDQVLQIDAESGLELEARTPGVVDLVRLINPETGEPLDLAPRHVVLTAGAGNARLRTQCGLRGDVMQRRPLHMTVVRGDLPVLNGHCVDGMQTRATITTARDYADRIVWQVGGQLAETGVHDTRIRQIERTRTMLTEILPGVPLAGLEWSTYRTDRAEGVTRAGRRPHEPVVRREGRTVTTWPTKLALVPDLVARVRQALPAAEGLSPGWQGDMLGDWPHPSVAAPPWEEHASWCTDVSVERDS